MSVVQPNLDKQSDTIVLHMWCHDSRVNKINKAVEKASQEVSARRLPDRATIAHLSEALCALNGEYIFENGLKCLWANGGDKFTLFQEEYTYKRNAGLEPFLLWDTHWKAFFSGADVTFETEVKRWLPSLEWVVLVVSQMGFLAYSQLDGHILGPADLSDWSVWPIAVKEQSPMSSSPFQQILSPTPASPSVSISNLFSDEVWSSPIHIPPITVPGNGTLNNGVKTYSPRSPSPVPLSSAVAQSLSIEQNRVVSMPSTSGEAPNASGPSSKHVKMAVTSTEAFHTLSVSPKPSESMNKDVSSLAMEARVTASMSVEPVNAPPIVHILSPTLGQGELMAGVETEVTVSRIPEILIAPNKSGLVSDIRMAPLTTALQDVLDKLVEAPMSMDVLSKFRNVIKEKDEKPDAGRLEKLMGLARRMNASKLSAACKQASDEVWSQLVFTNIQKTRTRTLKGCKVANRVNIASWDLIPVKGAKAVQQLFRHIHLASDSNNDKCTCCGMLYPCEYTSWIDVMKCRKCKMNRKSCSWADPANVVHNSDSEDSVIEMLTAVGMKKRSFEKIDNAIASFSSKRSKTHVDIDDARTQKVCHVDPASDRVTRSKSAAKKGPDQRNISSGSSLASKQPDVSLVECDKNDEKKSMIDGGLQLHPSVKIPTVTLRRFLPPDHGERASAPIPKPLTSDMALYTLPPVSVEEILDHASNPLNVEQVKKLFKHRETAVEEVKVQLRKMSLEEIIQEAARIVMDQAELQNTIESLELKWDRNEQMQDEILEMVSEHFMSFQSDLIEEVMHIKWKWQNR
ncbi:hypothetical protein ARMGADRAFT_1087745 [Armillaria gallica]|uniref:Uncharacterized protein n=1 Tax=Armillaria gallica TaxID=47427 RepID=A0A2H3DC67_ARMGA|nr:hypothetical protein ARMGADRAFT_1087745 [Armillaria gallica]